MRPIQDLVDIVWAFADQRAWPWDEAWYGKTTVDLFYTLLYSPSKWLPGMMGAFGGAAPGIAWAGQFFVPIGRMVRSIDAGLLLSVVSAQAVALYFVARALWDLSGGSRRIACAGLVVMAAAPLYVGLSHRYVVEVQQALAVAWFLLIMARAPRWSPLLTIGQLLLATTAAMLAKVSSPLFCFGPGLAALYYAVRYRGQSSLEPIGRSIATLAIAVPFAAATVVWYQRNIRSIVAHVSMASTGRVAELYGKADAFLPSLSFWMKAFGSNFFTTLTIVIAAIVLSVALVTAFNDRRPQCRFFDVAAVVAAVQILVTLAVFSLSSNRDQRYLLPLVSYAAVLVSWALERLNRPALTLVVIVCSALQWGHVHAQALGLVRRSTAVQWLAPAMRDPGQRALLDAVVDRTCTGTHSALYSNVIGVQLLSFNAPGVAYAASKKLGPAHGVTCDYDAITYYDTDERAAWMRLLGRNITYYISFDASTYTVPPGAVDAISNALNQPILTRIETSGQFQLEPGLIQRPGVLIFRRLDQVNHVARARSLSYHGMHALAIEELKQATTAQPENVEAWATLALACERAGDLSGAIAAGTQARRLSPRHYYVNMGLARTASRQKQWLEAIARAQDAAANAPGRSERANALALAAHASFESGNSIDGCARLAQASLDYSGSGLKDELCAHGCKDGRPTKP